MKQAFTFLILLINLAVFSQDRRNPPTYIQKEDSKEPVLSSPERVVQPRSNSLASSVEVEGIIIDKRAAAYYSIDELKSMSAQKAVRLNHIYVDSYEIVSDANILPDCHQAIKNELDLGPYNHLRKKNSRVPVTVSLKACKVTISLFSWDEIDLLK
jgi:hypothetical protein